MCDIQSENKWFHIYHINAHISKLNQIIKLLILFFLTNRLMFYDFLIIK